MSLKSCSIGKERRSCRSRLSTRKFHLIIFLELFWEMYVLSLRIMKRVRTVKYDKKIYKLKANYYKWKLWSFYHKRYTLKIWVDFKENYFKSFFFFAQYIDSGQSLWKILEPNYVKPRWQRSTCIEFHMRKCT